VGSDGEGLCNEFGLEFAIGWDDAPVGGVFPKIGVGSLTRTDDGDYSFGADYPNSPASFTSRVVPNGVSFAVTGQNANGYGYVLNKDITLDGNALLVDYTLENTGAKRIYTQEYVHNFVAIDHKPVGKHLVLSLAVEPPLEAVPSVMERDGKALHYRYTPEGLYMKLMEYPNTLVRWELIDTELGVGIREMGSFPVDYFALYGTGHLISPEVFIGIQLEPGDTTKYQRRYEFFKA